MLQKYKIEGADTMNEKKNWSHLNDESCSKPIRKKFD